MNSFERKNERKEVTLVGGIIAEMTIDERNAFQEWIIEQDNYREWADLAYELNMYSDLARNTRFSIDDLAVFMTKIHELRHKYAALDRRLLQLCKKWVRLNVDVQEDEDEGEE